MNLIKRVVCGFVVLGVCMAMAAPTFGGIVTVQSGDWNTGATWGGSVPPADEELEVAGDGDFGPGHIVTITSDVLDADALAIWGEGKVIQSAGSFTFGDMVIGDYTVGTYEISGGTLTCNGDAIAVGNGNNPPDYVGDGTFRIIGDDATINLKGFKTNNSGAPESLLSLVFDSTGISPINAEWGENGDGWMDLEIDLTAFGGAGDIPIMNIGGIGTQGSFGSVLVDGAPLATTPHTLSYVGGDGNDVVLTVVPEPATMSLLALGGLAMLIVRRRRA